MWNVMVFADETRTSIVKVMTFQTIKQMSEVIGEPPQSISNFYHGLIRPRGALKYIAMFKN